MLQHFWSTIDILCASNVPIRFFLTSAKRNIVLKWKWLPLRTLCFESQFRRRAKYFDFIWEDNSWILKNTHLLPSYRLSNILEHIMYGFISFNTFTVFSFYYILFVDSYCHYYLDRLSDILGWYFIFWCNWREYSDITC